MTVSSTGPTRVVIADDSAVMRRLLRDALRTEPSLEIVGEAADGAEALAACAQHRPDVLTLDLSMPNTNGLDVLAELRRVGSTVRVIVISSFSASLVERALDVLDAGASDLVAKPKPGESFPEFAAAVRATVVSIGATRRNVAPPRPGRLTVPRAQRRGSDTRRVLVIASSTGGPRALSQLVPQLGARIGAGGVVVQHMPPGFTTALSRRLDAGAQLDVREAVAGDRLRDDLLLVAPAGWHLRMTAGGAALSDDEPVMGIRPRADFTIRDLTELYGARVVLVVLTGMGNDGLAGARAVREVGGIVLAQDEDDCVVYGMPRQVVEADLADATGSVDELAVLIERALATPVTPRN